MKKLHKLITLVRNSFYRQALLRYRVAAVVEHDALLHKIGRKLKTAVVIGANRGQFALAARHHAQEAYFIAFEPLEKAVEVFEKIFQSDPCVELHRSAIGLENGSPGQDEIDRVHFRGLPFRVQSINQTPFPNCYLTNERGQPIWKLFSSGHQSFVVSGLNLP